jgi:hypothetical protein
MKLDGKVADDFIVDVRDGVEDDALREKYGVSSLELVLLKGAAKELIEKRKLESSKGRTVSAREFLKEIRAGTDEETLKMKFNLTSRQFQTLLRELISAGVATPLELSNRLRITESQVAEVLTEWETASKLLD